MNRYRISGFGCFVCLGLLSACSGNFGVPGVGGLSGKPGTVSPGQILSMGQDMVNAATLSDEDVIKMASEAVAELDSLNPIAPPDSPYTKRLDRLVENLHSEEGLDLNYKVYLVSDVNAFSLADGSVRVFAGLMDIMDDDELRFIIGHEIGHVKHGHRKDRMKRAYMASAAAKAANTGVRAATSSNLGGAAAVAGTNLAAGLLSEVLQAQFSQGDETESDEMGLTLLSKYDYSKSAAVTALLKLGGGNDEEKEIDFLTSISSSHPDSRSRAEHIQSLIPELKGQPLPVVTLERPSEQAVAKMSQSGGEDKVVANNSASPTGSQDGKRTETNMNSVGLQGWYVQVGAFSEKVNAESRRDTLGDEGDVAHIVPIHRSGSTLYRVVMGPYQSKTEALQARESVRSVSDAFVKRFTS